MKINIIERLKTEAIAVHCDTEEKANDFLEVLHNHGCKWLSDYELTHHNNYRIYTNETCYIVNQNSKVEYSDKKFYENNNYKIISYDEFMKLYIDEIIECEMKIQR